MMGAQGQDGHRYVPTPTMCQLLGGLDVGVKWARLARGSPP